MPIANINSPPINHLVRYLNCSTEAIRIGPSAYLHLHVLQDRDTCTCSCVHTRRGSALRLHLPVTYRNTSHQWALPNNY